MIYFIGWVAPEVLQDSQKSTVLALPSAVQQSETEENLAIAPDPPRTEVEPQPPEFSPRLPSPAPLTEVDLGLQETPSLEEETNLETIVPVAELADVQPTDWAFQALQGLRVRYNCLAGYPDGTFGGEGGLSRYEFAAALKACLDAIQARVAQSQMEAVSQADWLSLQNLQQQFAAELAGLRNRVNQLETRTQFLESHQFSPTTRLVGQAIFGIQGSNQIGVDLFPQDGIPERSGQAQFTQGYNLQLSLATSFRGDDLLLVGLQTGNIQSSTEFLSTNMGRLSYESGLAGDLVISDLSYRFALGDRLGIILGPAGVNPVNTFRGISPLEGGAEGTLSLFGQRNPILSLGNGTGGVGFDWQIAPRISLQGVYSAELPAFALDNTVGGFLGGRFVAGAQLSFAPSNNLAVGLHYLYSHSPDGILGTGIGDSQVISPFVLDFYAFQTHAIGATAAWRVNPGWTFGGWGGWTTSASGGLSGSVETTNWMVFSAFPDLGGRGNLGAILVGQPPKITSSNLPDGFNFPRFATDGNPGGQKDSALHLELLYRLRINDSLFLTPGVMMILNPNHNAANEPLLIGGLRATFQF